MAAEPNDLTAEFFERLEAGEDAWAWVHAQKAERPSSFMQGPALFTGLDVLERRIKRLEVATGLPPLKLKGDDVSEEAEQSNGDGEELEIHETATLAGADTPVPEDIEERLDREEDPTKEIEE